MNRSGRTGVWAGAALAMLLAACGSDGDTGEAAKAASEALAGERAAEPSPSDEPGNELSLPAEWPANFPAPPANATLSNIAGPLVQDDRALFTVDYLAEGMDLSEVYAHYLRELPAAGWGGRFDANPAAAEIIADVHFEGEGASGNVMLDANRGPVLIRVFMYIDR
jgi:hypothetical protein